MARYNIYYRQYCIMARAYIPHIDVVDTEDIYHEVGKLICTSLEKVENVRYTKPRASKEDCEKLWVERGYRKLTDNTWIMDRPSDDVAPKSEVERLEAELTKAKTEVAEIFAEIESAHEECIYINPFTNIGSLKVLKFERMLDELKKKYTGDNADG